ncbi:hypothetical protein BDV97DRAFT_357512 [Delphinella strobiligena]|nr:hypothetical protein BDV97DRAFT_357512 [Delphinella strobiligena]
MGEKETLHIKVDESPSSRFCIPTKIKDCASAMSPVICCCPSCGCESTRGKAERVNRADTDVDTISLQSYNGSLVAGQEGVEDIYEGLERSMHNDILMERWLRAHENDEGDSFLVLIDREIPPTQCRSPCSMASIMNEPGDPDSLTQSTRSLPRSPSPMPALFDYIGARFGDDWGGASITPLRLSADEGHRRNPRSTRRSSREEGN